MLTDLQSGLRIVVTIFVWMKNKDGNSVSYFCIDQYLYIYIYMIHSEFANGYIYMYVCVCMYVCIDQLGEHKV